MAKYLGGSTKPSLSRLIEHVRVPLYRNGYALVFSSFTTAGLGMVFWMLAAHNYSTEVIGLNVAMLSAINFLATISQLNLMNALNRFLPTAGRASFRFVGYSYLVSTTVALLVSLIYIVGIDFWSPSLGEVKSNFTLALVFTTTVVGWVIFVFQDSVLTGLSQAIWVPVENFLFAVLKLILLIVLATVVPEYGVLLSWTIAIGVTLFPINFLLFRYLIPRHIEKTKNIITEFIPKQIAAYSAGDYLGTLAWRATDNLLPILIIEKVSASANAHYYLSWTIAYSLFSISRNMGMSLVVEASAVPSKLGKFSYGILIQVARMVVPAVIVLVVGAPYILRLFGSEYSADGTTVFRLLCLSAIPNIANNLYLSIARIQRRVGRIILVQVTLSSLTLALAYILLETRGLAGIGIALLTAQTTVAIVLWFTEMRSVWLYRLNIQILLRLFTSLRKLWWYWRARKHIRAAFELVPTIVAKVPELPNVPPPVTWKPQAALQTVNDVIVIPLSSTAHSPWALLKIAHSAQGNSSLQQQITILNELRADPRLTDWHPLLPTILSSDEIGESFYAVERILPGLDARFATSNPEILERVLRLAVATITEFHRSTATALSVDAAICQKWIDEPIGSIRQLFKDRVDTSGSVAALDRLTTRLYEAFSARQLTVSWIHGDFVLGNLLVSEDGTQLTGILDWDLTAPNELPQLDVLQLLLSTRMLVKKHELGHIVCDFLEGASWSPFERSLLDVAQFPMTDDPVDMQNMILLCWLRHIASGLRKSSRSAGHWVWITWNIKNVLKCL